jgi:LytS/YehU family sensor histidine kinase
MKTKIAIVALAVLGALAAGFLGGKWMGDLGGMSDQQRMAAQLMGQTEQINKMTTSAFVLLAGFLAGLAGAFLSFTGRFALGGGLMLAFGVLPVLFTPQALIFTSPLIAAGVVALLAHFRARGQAPPAL